MIADDVTQAISVRFEGADSNVVYEAARMAVNSYRNLVETVEQHHELCGCQGCMEVYPWITEVHWHGTVYGYGYHKCRCVKCKKAQSKYHQMRKG